LNLPARRSSRLKTCPDPQSDRSAVRFGDHGSVAEWIYFIYPPRENFAAQASMESNKDLR